MDSTARALHLAADDTEPAARRDRAVSTALRRYAPAAQSAGWAVRVVPPRHDGAGRPGTCGARPPRAVRSGDQRQVSLAVKVPVAGVVVVRLSPLSQMTVPSGFLMRYLYAIGVPAGSCRLAVQTG